MENEQVKFETRIYNANRKVVIADSWFRLDRHQTNGRE